MSQTSLYLSISYEDYKDLEAQMRAFAETVHTSTGGFYHKSIRLQINPGLVMEFHGPLVKAAMEENGFGSEDGNPWASLI